MQSLAVLERSWRSLLVRGCLAVLVTLGTAGAAEPRKSEHPNDPTSARVLSMFREHGHYVDAPMYPKDHPYWENLQWYRDQGAAVRPALMFLLTDEYRGDYGKMSDAVSALKNAPGDQTELLDFLRSELAEQPEPRPDDYYLLVNAALAALSTLGDRNDLPLIRQFESDDDVRMRLNVKRLARDLEQRIAKKANGQVRQPRDPRGQEGSGVPHNGAGASEMLEPDADSVKAGGIQWAIWGAGGLLVVALVVYFALRRRDA